MFDRHSFLAKPVSLEDAYTKVGRHAPGFDTIRITAASAVVFHHSMALQHDIVRDDWIFAFSKQYTTLGFLAVCLFFCLSGFLVVPGLAKNLDVVGYLSRRIMRIMPLLIVTVVGTVLVIGPIATSLPLEAYFADGQTWLYLKNMTTSLSLPLPGVTNQTGGDEVNGALWTLRYEWLCYLILAGLAVTRLLTFRAFVALLWIGATAFTAYSYEGQTANYSQPEMLAHLFAYFGAGTLAYLYREHIPVSPLLGLAAFALLLLSWYIGLGALFAPALTAYLVVMLGLVRWPWSDLLARADLSYGIYLLHGPSMVLLLAFWAPTSFVALFVAVLAMAAILALASWTWLEKPALAHKGWPAQVWWRFVAGLGLKRKGELT